MEKRKKETSGQIWYRTVYLVSARWKTLRTLAMLGTGGMCGRCRRKQAREVHHDSYRWCNKGGIRGMIKELGDLIPVCANCHEALHKVKSKRKGKR